MSQREAQRSSSRGIFDSDAFEEARDGRLETLGSQIEVMRHEEALRAAAFGRGVFILSTIGLIVASVRDNERFAKAAIMGATSILALAGAGVWWRARDVERYSRRTFRLFGVASAVSSLVLVHALGVFTPITVIIVLGLAFFVHGRDTRIIFPVAASVIAAYAISAVLVTAGLLPDRGVWRTPGLQQHVSMTIIITAVMITQFALARSNHRALTDAIGRWHEAIRVARTREAELDEVRENLDVALRAGNGGRLSGTSLAGYRVGDVVGRGAMGEVYMARREDEEGRARAEDRPAFAAIKVLRHLDDDVAARRFAREAEIATKVRGENLVRVYESGLAHDGSVYIIMELLSGHDLSAILRERTLLSLDETVQLIEGVASGLAVLHEAGVIHRDLKPQNLFLSRSEGDEGTWKILDYGVSKMIGSGTVTENNLVGTPGYMSPEQAEGREVDARSDIFSLGAVAYRALTGRRAFSGAELPQILYQIVHGTPVRPRELVPSLPKEVEVVLSIALAKSPADRFANAKELAEALRRASRPEVKAPTSKRRAPAARAWRAEPTTLTMPRIDKPSRRELGSTKTAAAQASQEHAEGRDS